MRFACVKSITIHVRVMTLTGISVIIQKAMN
jgi:hypothetical protein